MIPQKETHHPWGAKHIATVHQQGIFTLLFLNPLPLPAKEPQLFAYALKLKGKRCQSNAQWERHSKRKSMEPKQSA